MAFNIVELRETLELNRNEIMNNHLLTNEYMIDDIMRELGYNKRRNKDVKRLLDKPIDWEVLSTGSPRLAVKVFALGDTISDESLQEAMNYCKSKPFSIFIVTNGEALTVCRYNKVKREYAEVCDISLLEELNDTKKVVIEAISNDGFNLEIIDNIVSERDISHEKVMEVIKNNLGLLASHVATWLGDSSNSKIEQCKVVIDSLIFNENKVTANTVDVSEYTTIIEQLQKELEEAKQVKQSDAEDGIDVSEYTNKIAELQDKIAEYEVKIAEYKADDSSASEKIAALDATVAELKELITAKDSEISQLNNRLEEIKVVPNTGNGIDESIKSEIDAYREKIQELANKVAESDDIIDKLKTELKEAKDNLNNMSGADKQKALELLGVIEDSKELPRSYVAVINTELIQYDDLPTFVGRSLQKLYEIKSYEASQFIFNGDIFKLAQPAERNDLIMNNKAYDVKVDGIHEDEVLNKLRIVYSHFSSDIIFECKKIGSIDNIDSTSANKRNTDTKETDNEVNVEWDNIEEVNDKDNIDDDMLDGVCAVKTENEDESIDAATTTSLSLDKTDEVELSQDFNGESGSVFYTSKGFDDGAFESNVEDSEFGVKFSGEFDNDAQLESDISQSSSSQLGSDIIRDTTDSNGFDDTNINEESFANMQNTATEQTYLNGILCSQLLQIDELIWINENVTFNTIKYIGSSSINFNINMNKEAISNEQLFCKCLDAVLALSLSMGNNNVLSLLRQTDLSQVNNFIKLYTDEYANYPRINGTKYVVAGIESIVQVASILADTCNKLGIDASDIFLFFDATTTSQQLLDNWGYEEEAIQLREYTDLQAADTADSVVVLKGGIFNNIIVTRNSLQAHKDIFKETLAVRTNYLAKMINNENDFVEVIRAIITEASINGQHSNINSIGNVIGEQYKLVSENPMETSSNSVKIDVNGREMYVSIVENWQMPLSIIKVHTALLANTSIAVKLNINSQALNFYLTEFEVVEPSLYLAVSSFCKYVQSCIK